MPSLPACARKTWAIERSNAELSAAPSPTELGVEKGGGGEKGPSGSAEPGALSAPLGMEKLRERARAGEVDATEGGAAAIGGACSASASRVALGSSAAGASSTTVGGGGR